MADMSFRFEDDYSKYLNPNRFYSYQNIHTFILIGGRGIGKTTGFVKKSVRNFMKNGEEFVYCRRYKTEIMKAKELLDPIVSGVKTQSIGNGIFSYVHDKVRLGYGCCLSLQQSYKSGINFSRVTTLIYDEAILYSNSRNRYLSDELVALFELISTIFRTRTDYRIFILGNNADMFNPYFAYFNVPRFEDSYIDKNRGLYCELLKNKPELLKQEEETPLYRLVNGTPYGAYHYNNDVLTENVGTIGEKPEKSELIGRIMYNDYTLNIYRFDILGMYVEFRPKQIKDPMTYVLFEHGNPNYVMIDDFRKSSFRTFIENAYYNGTAIYNESKSVTMLQYVLDILR